MPDIEMPDIEMPDMEMPDMEMPDMEPDAVFRHAADLETNPAPDGMMVYQPARERVHFLNQTALVVFELCGLGKSVRDIEVFLQNAYDLPEPPAESVRACIRSLVDETLVEACPPSSSAP